MRATVLLRLLVFSGFVTLHVQSGQVICGADQYTVTNGSFLYCLSCDTCHAGYGLYPLCGLTVTYPPSNIGCKACPNETFSDKLDSAPCYSCQQCAMLEIVAAPCTRFLDQICNGTCEKGYFFSKKVPHSCQQCSYCCFDGKDEEQPECVKQGLNATGRHCSARLDKHCVPHLSSSTAAVTTQTHLPSLTQSPTSLKLTSSSPSHSTSPSTTTVTDKETPVTHLPATHSPDLLAKLTSSMSHPTNPQVGNHLAIIIALSVVLAAMIVAAMFYMYKKKKKQISKRKRAQNIPPDRSPGNCDNNTIQVPPQGVAYRVYPRVQAVQINTGYATSSASATPEGSDDEVEGLPATKQQRSKEPQSNGSVQKKDGTTESLDPSVHVQAGNQGEDSVGQSMPRRPTFEALKRTLSLSHDYQLLQQEDPDEPQAGSSGASGGNDEVDSNSKSQGNGNVSQDAASLHSPSTGSTPQPSAVALRVNLGFASSNPGTPQVSPHGTRQIKLAQQPILKNQREGSRVEFTCEVQVQGNCEVWYQWLKDDSELPQENSASLILDSVKMHDFGCYRCRITHIGGHGEAVTSEPAFLEVSPCEGKRLKYLREVDLDTRDKIAILLEGKTPGLGGYRQIATKYGMQEHLVRGLENSRQPGQDVMEFLRGSNPNLTVYSFCKTLKEDNIKQFDIVRVLKDHLSIESK